MTNEVSPTTHYASYLLRLQLTSSDNQPVWLVSLENTANGSLRSFPNVEALTAFLLAEFGGRRLIVKGSLPIEQEDKRAPESE